MMGCTQSMPHLESVLAAWSQNVQVNSAALSETMIEGHPKYGTHCSNRIASPGGGVATFGWCKERKLGVAIDNDEHVRMSLVGDRYGFPVDKDLIKGTRWGQFPVESHIVFRVLV